MRPSRSLTVSGRKLWLGLIAASTLLVAGAAGAMGAWLILPFAGLEVMLVWYAFRVIGHHDEDDETLSVSGSGFRWERQCGRETSLLRGSRYWARLADTKTGGRLQLQLSYAGNTVLVGQLMPNEQREILAKRLRQLFRSQQN